MKINCFSFIIACVVALLLAGCDKPEAKSQRTVADTDVAERIFNTRGVVRSVPEGGRTLVVRHEEIPNYMPKMTMELNVRDPNEVVGLERNDEIEFQLVATADTHWIQNIKRVGKMVEEATAPPAPKLVSMLDEGDAMPDYELLAETGRMVKFSDYRGKALAFTFIFTRCPLPDFCPRMNQNLGGARDLLLAQTNAPTNWQLLCISFDPDYDTPERLRRYALSYRGENADRWLFAVASQEVLATLAPQVDLMLAREAGGSISHNLRTIVVDPQGRIFQIFVGNQWTAEELAESIQAAAQRQ